MKKLYWFIIGIVILLFIIIILNANKGPTVPPANINWDRLRAQDIPTINEQGWGAPQLVVVSSPGWEDSAYISADGNKLYYDYYPGDLISDVARRQFSDDLDYYVSEKPFTTRTKLTQYYLAEDISPFI